MQDKLIEAESDRQKEKQLIVELSAKLMNKDQEIHALSCVLNDQVFFLVLIFIMQCSLKPENISGIIRITVVVMHI